MSHALQAAYSTFSFSRREVGVVGINGSSFGMRPKQYCEYVSDQIYPPSRNKQESVVILVGNGEVSGIPSECCRRDEIQSVGR